MNCPEGGSVGGGYEGGWEEDADTYGLGRGTGMSLPDTLERGLGMGLMGNTLLLGAEMSLPDTLELSVGNIISSSSLSGGGGGGGGIFNIVRFVRIEGGGTMNCPEGGSVGGGNEGGWEEDADTYGLGRGAGMSLPDTLERGLGMGLLDTLRRGAGMGGWIFF